MLFAEKMYYSVVISNYSVLSGIIRYYSVLSVTGLQGCVVSLRPEICELIKLLLKLMGTFEIQSDIIC